MQMLLHMRNIHSFKSLQDPETLEKKQRSERLPTCFFPKQGKSPQNYHKVPFSDVWYLLKSLVILHPSILVFSPLLFCLIHAWHDYKS